MTVNKIFLETATGCFPVGVREKSNHSIIALGEKQHIFKVGEVELDESYFGARRVHGNAIESPQWEIDVAHTAKFLFPLECGNTW